MFLFLMYKNTTTYTAKLTTLMKALADILVYLSYIY